MPATMWKILAISVSVAAGLGAVWVVADFTQFKTRREVVLRAVERDLAEYDRKTGKLVILDQNVRYIVCGPTPDYRCFGAR